MFIMHSRHPEVVHSCFFPLPLFGTGLFICFICCMTTTPLFETHLLFEEIRYYPLYLSLREHS